MKKRKFYTLNEIIFGLRGEYLRSEQNLSNLKNFCLCDEKLIKNFDFSLSKYSGEKPNLVCDFEKKENIIQKFFRKSSVVHDFVALSNCDSVLCTKDNSNKYYLFKNSDLDSSNQDKIYIPSQNSYDFYMQAEAILNSRFASKFDSTYDFKNGNIECKVSINFHELNVVVKFNHKVISNFWYDSKSDSIKMNFFIDKEISNLLIALILAIKVPKDSLSSYHIGIINNSNVSDKKTLIRDIEPCMYETDIAIKEYNTQIVLSKIKGK